MVVLLRADARYVGYLDHVLYVITVLRVWGSVIMTVVDLPFRLIVEIRFIPRISPHSRKVCHVKKV